MRNFMIVSLVFLLTACASVSSIGDGKTHIATCNSMWTSEESCAEKGANEACQNGKHKIKVANSGYTLMRGFERSVTFECLNK